MVTKSRLLALSLVAVVLAIATNVAHGSLRTVVAGTRYHGGDKISRGPKANGITTSTSETVRTNRDGSVTVTPNTKDPSGHLKHDVAHVPGAALADGVSTSTSETIVKNPDGSGTVTTKTTDPAGQVTQVKRNVDQAANADAAGATSTSTSKRIVENADGSSTVVTETKDATGKEAQEAAAKTSAEVAGKMEKSIRFAAGVQKKIAEATDAALYEPQPIAPTSTRSGMRR